MITSAVVEHFDSFDDSIVFWVDITGVSKTLISQAKQIDKENFNEECFGCCVLLDKDGWIVVHQDECLIYYIDNIGDKHWLESELNEQEKQVVIDMCVSTLCVQAYKQFICYDMQITNKEPIKTFDYWNKCREYYNSLDLPNGMNKSNYHFETVMNYPIEKTMYIEIEDLAEKFTFLYIEM